MERRDRLVTKDEAIDVVWGGRFISDSAVSTVLKSLRRALGDDGESQRLIRTVRGRGYRFVAEVSDLTGPAGPPPEAGRTAADSRPRLAILPFRRLGASGAFDVVADAVPADLIAGLSRLRWLRVLAQETTFRFRDAGSLLQSLPSGPGATYVLSGIIEVAGGRTLTLVELSDLGSGSVVWAEQFPGSLDGVHQTRAAIANAREFGIGPIMDQQVRTPGLSPSYPGSG